MSATSTPRHISGSTERLQKLLLRIRTRHGTGEPSLMNHESHLSLRGLGFQIRFALGELLLQGDRLRRRSPAACEYFSMACRTKSIDCTTSSIRTK